ncbi:MAG TPA: MFS transporter [bacterium]|nr:MFS transporter [bacterium]
MKTASRRWAPSLTLGAAGFCASMSWQVVAPILSLHLAHLGFSFAEIGIVVGVFSLSMGVVELQAGVIAAAVGRRRQLLGAFAANALCLAVTAAGQARALVAVSLAAVGAARGVLVPPLHATVADSATPEDRGRAFGTFWLCTSFAALIGPALGGFVAARTGERAPFVLGALFSLAAIPLLAGRPMPGRTAGRASFRDFAAFLSTGSVTRLGVAILFCYSVAGIWTTFLPLYASRQGVSILFIGWIFAVQGGMYAVMQVPTGRLIARDHGGRWLRLAAIAGTAGTALAIPLIHTVPLLLAAGAVYGTAWGIMPVTFATLMTGRIPPDQYMAAMSVYNSAIDLGLFTGPLLGAAVTRWSLTAPFLLALPLGLAAAAVGPGAPPRPAGPDG